MKGKRYIVSAGRIATSIFLVLTLLWLTLSTPFVYAGQQVKKEAAKQNGEKTSNNDSPFSGSEEKSETGNTISEYLHDHDQHEQTFTLVNSFYKCHPDDLYFAFHPELISPPPEA